LEDEEFAGAAVGLLLDGLGWVREHYRQFEFWVERDLVWTLQTRLRRVARERELDFLVLGDYPVLAGTRRTVCADLVIRDRQSGAMVAAEFKFEPSHERTDFLAMPDKLPAVQWRGDGVAKDIALIKTFVDDGAVDAAFAVFVDEGRYFRHRPAPPGSAWVDWDDAGPSILWTRWPAR
jgi:hypothetical protein